MRFIGLTVCSIVLTFIAQFCYGYTLQQLWDWFVVTTFSLDSLSIPQAIGLSSVVTFMTHQLVTTGLDDKSAGERIFIAFIYVLIRCLSALCIGYIVNLFM